MGTATRGDANFHLATRCIGLTYGCGGYLHGTTGNDECILDFGRDIDIDYRVGINCVHGHDANANCLTLCFGFVIGGRLDGESSAIDIGVVAEIGMDCSFDLRHRLAGASGDNCNIDSFVVRIGGRG